MELYYKQEYSSYYIPIFLILMIFPRVKFTTLVFILEGPQWK